MAEDKRYNGWTNYETWNVKLWMDNEEGSQSYYSDLAQEAYNDAEADGTFTREERATLDLSAKIKDEYESAMFDWLEESGKQASVWADLLGAALGEVNWHEIAENMIDDVDKEEETAEDSDSDEDDE